MGFEESLRTGEIAIINDPDAGAEIGRQLTDAAEQIVAEDTVVNPVAGEQIAQQLRLDPVGGLAESLHVGFGPGACGAGVGAALCRVRMAPSQPSRIQTVLGVGTVNDWQWRSGRSTSGYQGEVGMHPGCWCGSIWLR